ncbi:gliding motility-associated C-terminal domain-containing protein [Reichenbachiella carrageenanivorans]|uniref:Gliding motility-associated C-terminal domain-containing protein n=1 Tax=Reichenbachiella carrageenanivorans TaxID=2979869 RepID=A0ABY6CY72_9BACT|nr:gliding motility-associated C-terminal domain-containing protein [Reichenbachiella carrageenanivorans]UXX78818.1 gliding motility-associated C-terminal domain-containing protein [Reichenbachiella carrageenanivorans]
MKRLPVILLLLALTLSANSHAQNYVEWEVGHTVVNRAYIRDMKPGQDGGFILVGASQNYPSDAFIMKVDDAGAEVWTHTLGGTSADDFIEVALTDDGGYIAVGSTESDDGDVPGNYGIQDDIWAVKFDVDGNIVWNKNFGGTRLDEAFGVAKMLSGDFVITGRTFSQDLDFIDETIGGGNGTLYALKIDTDGNTLDFGSYGSSGIQRDGYVAVSQSGGVILSGVATHASGDVSNHYGGYSDIWVLKTDLDLDLTWEKNFGGSGNDYTAGVLATSDGGFITYGSTNSSDHDIATLFGGNDMFIVKVDASGNKEWCRTIGSVSEEYCLSVRETSDGGYIVGGRILNHAGAFGSYDNVVVKLDASGEIEWQELYGSASVDYYAHVLEISPDHYVMATSTHQTSASGNKSVVGNVWLAAISPCSDDVRAPDFTTCPGNQSVTAGSTLLDYTASAAAWDGCDSAPVITQSPAVGTAVISGMTVTLIATDASGNVNNTCTFIVNTFGDATDPDITCPINQSLSCTTILPDYTSLATATDNVDPNPTITQSPAVGSMAVDGMTVTLTATDNSGNTDVCTFMVSLTSDAEDPVITGLTDQDVNCNTVLLDYTGLGTVSDNCDLSPSVVQSPAVGSTVVDGMIVTLSATDDAGNTADYTFVVNIKPDAVAPGIVGLTNQIVNCGEVLSDYRTLGTVIDNCDAAPVVTQSPAIGTAVTDGMTVTLTATDAVGNADDFIFQVFIHADVESPMLSTIDDQTVGCGTLLQDYTSLTSVSDNCDIDIQLIQSPAAGVEVVDGMLVDIKGLDDAGNFYEITFQILVQEDLLGPVLNCPSDQVLTCGNLMPDFTSSLRATDVCAEIEMVTQSPKAGEILVVDTEVELVATDSYGNSSSCIFQIQIEDIEVDAGEDQVILEGESTQLSVRSIHSGVVTWSPNYGLADTQTMSPTTTAEFTTDYTVQLETVEGCVGEDQVTVWVEQPVFSSGFSPNGDGINDTWQIKGIEKYPDNTVYVYNRWGNLIYEQRGYDNQSRSFDGQANNLTGLSTGQLPEGTYFYHIDIPSGHDIEKTDGYIMIKR